jgi:3-phosphoshikimate 1-carboxyvinyltransferase
VKPFFDSIEALGVGVTCNGDEIVIDGRGRELRPAARVSAGDSLAALQMLIGMLAPQPFACVIEAEGSLAQRSVFRYLEPLREMGADIRPTERGTAPIRVFPSKLRAMRHDLPLPHAGVKTVVLIAGLFLEGESSVVEPQPSRDHVERALGLTRAATSLATPISARSTRVPSNPAVALPFIAAAALHPDAELTLREVAGNSRRTQGLGILERAGLIADRTALTGLAETAVDIHILGPQRIRPFECTVPLSTALADELPALALAATAAEGSSRLAGFMDARQMSCDRVAAMVENLYRLGVITDELDDGLIIAGRGELPGGGVAESFSDPWVALTLFAAGLCASHPFSILGLDDARSLLPELDDLRAALQII